VAALHGLKASKLIDDQAIESWFGPDAC